MSAGRRLATVAIAATLLVAGCAIGEPSGAAPTGTSVGAVTSPTTPTPPSTPTSTPSATPSPVLSGTVVTPPKGSGPASDTRHFEKVTRITGALTPKSVVASPTGMVVAQNMIYTHTVSVFDARHELVTTIPDRITPSVLGVAEYESPLRGGPVEASFSPDGRHVWISNYSMSGQGFSKPGDDVCSPEAGFDRSFLYRIDTSTWKIDGAVLVGAVPKYVDATPDGRTVLVTNWCSWDMSVVDTATMKETARVPIGRYPRGIAVSPDSSTAYVAVMGSSKVLAVDLARVSEGEGATRTLSVPGRGPRHLNLSPDGKTLYATLNQVGVVAKIDVSTGDVLDKVATGSAPRSSVLSPDGTALFVVNYESGTVSRVRTSDMKVLESRDVDHHPIGITYNPVTDEVWVCSYIGVINVFADVA